MYRTAFTLFFFIALGSGAHAQDQCRDILSARLFNTETGTRKEEFANAEFYWACGASLSEAQNYVNRESSQSGQGGGSVSYGVFSVEGGGGSSSSNTITEQHLNRWKQENCTNLSSEKSQSAFEYYANASVAGGVVQTWRDCMIKREGLSCWATPHGNKILFTLNWRNFDTELPEVRAATATVGDERNEVRQPGEKILIGEDSYETRREADLDALFTVRLRHRERFSFICSAYVPAIRQVTAPPPEMPAAVRRMIDNFPNRVITIIVGAGAGGTKDTEARRLAKKLMQDRNWTVVIANRAGGKGRVAAIDAANADPDGYTVLAGLPVDWFAPENNLVEIGTTGFYVPAETPQGIIEKLLEGIRGV